MLEFKRPNVVSLVVETTTHQYGIINKNLENQYSVFERQQVSEAHGEAHGRQAAHKHSRSKTSHLFQMISTTA